MTLVSAEATTVWQPDPTRIDFVFIAGRRSDIQQIISAWPEVVRTCGLRHVQPPELPSSPSSNDPLGRSSTRIRHAAGQGASLLRRLEELHTTFAFEDKVTIAPGFFLEEPPN